MIKSECCDEQLKLTLKIKDNLVKNKRKNNQIVRLIVLSIVFNKKIARELAIF